MSRDIITEAITLLNVVLMPFNTEGASTQVKMLDRVAATITAIYTEASRNTTRNRECCRRAPTCSVLYNVKKNIESSKINKPPHAIAR